jgi:membrane protein implicated in regulation of membrane protease activity
MMDALLAQVDYWHWLIFGGVLLLIEVLAPSFFFLWMAVAAAVVALVMLLVPELDWQYQLMIFSVLSVVSIVLFRRYQRASPAPTDQPALNRRGEQYIGRTFTLQEPIVNHTGVLHVDDTSWRVSGDDLPAGTRVTVTGADGVILQVRRNDR